MAKKVFRTRQELEDYTREQMELVMDDVYKKLLNRLIDIIKKDIYNAYQPEFYERTGDLLNKKNWEVKRTKYRNRIIRTLYFKGDRFTFYNNDPKSPSGYIHGNYLYGAFEPKDFLAMLNGETKNGGNPFGFPDPDELGRKPFWDDFLTYCDKKYKLLFKNSCKKYGIPIK